MQKLSEAPDKKKGDPWAKIETLSAKERSLLSFSSDQQSENT